ncbi:MSHA pilin protein MshD [Gammaproteobacteria bacterium]
MFHKLAFGFTLIEMVMAIIIISVGLTGVLAAFNISIKSSADPLIHKQMLVIAEEMMEEILLKPYAINPVGTISGCNRSSADDIRDYDGYTQPICDIDGTLVTGLTGYNVNVVVGLETWQGIDNTLRITVSVARGGETLSLTGWRTNYAVP